MVKIGVFMNELIFIGILINMLGINYLITKSKTVILLLGISQIIFAVVSAVYLIEYWLK